MKDIVVISYDDPKNLGKYFEKCRDDLESYIESSSITPNIHCIHSDCTKEKIDNIINILDDDYCVVVYAHGNKDFIVDQNKNTLIDKNDVHHFHNAIFYSTACSNAEKEGLGYELILRMSKLFFGYSKKAYGIKDESEHWLDDYFVQTDNYALKEILNGIRHGQDLYEKTYDFFYTKYRKLEEIDTVSAAWLYHNMDVMRVYEYPNKEYG